MTVKENIMDVIDINDGTDMELFSTEAERNNYIGETAFFDSNNYRSHYYVGESWSKDVLKMFLEGR